MPQERMRIEHIAIWTNDLENLKEFYCRYFSAQSGEKYHNPNKQFSSYFLRFSSGARLELMHQPDLSPHCPPKTVGLAHLAIALGSGEKVDQMTDQLENDGYERMDGPRRTGDGYYESTFLDPDGNSIELTI